LKNSFSVVPRSESQTFDPALKRRASMAPTVLDAGKQIPKLGFLAGTGAECADVAPLGRQLATNFWDLAASRPATRALYPPSANATPPPLRSHRPRRPAIQRRPYLPWRDQSNKF
jgi:hypothetical protein